ncbi:MAG TPA: hypothetical protein VGN72_21270 [Tepidisphaeraceae bacterium]|jgi:hypothetical protein|nr:hypothetical protein [Tepidisphaeraceae bacterium]
MRVTDVVYPVVTVPIADVDWLLGAAMLSALGVCTCVYWLATLSWSMPPAVLRLMRWAVSLGQRSQLTRRRRGRRHLHQRR